MINKYYEISKYFYKKAIVIDICTVPSEYSLRVLLYFVHQSLRYYLLYLLSSFTDVSSLESKSMEDLLQSRYISCIDEKISSFLRSANMFIQFTMQNSNYIDDETIELKNEILSWLHYTMNASNIDCFDPEQHTLLLGAVMHGNDINYAGISLRKVEK